jgi:hypothetical protein
MNVKLLDVRGKNGIQNSKQKGGGRGGGAMVENFWSWGSFSLCTNEVSSK